MYAGNYFPNSFEVSEMMEECGEMNGSIFVKAADHRGHRRLIDVNW